MRRAVPLLARHALQQLGGLQEPAQELGVAPGDGAGWKPAKIEGKCGEKIGISWDFMGFNRISWDFMGFHGIQ